MGVPQSPNQKTFTFTKRTQIISKETDFFRNNINIFDKVNIFI